MFQSQSCDFGFFNATEKTEAETASDVGNWREQEIDRHPFEMPIRLKAGQLSYICFDWSLSPVSSVELLDQTKRNVVGRYVNDRECVGLGRYSEKHSSNYKCQQYSATMFDEELSGANRLLSLQALLKSCRHTTFGSYDFRCFNRYSQKKEPRKRQGLGGKYPATTMALQPVDLSKSPSHGNMG